MNKIKLILPDALAILLFVVISCLYFIGPLSEGKVLSGHDHTGAVGSGTEIAAYRATHNGETPRWTNAIFGGMPTYQISPSYGSTSTLSHLQQAYHLYLPTVASYVFMMLLGFYIMLRCFNFRVWMAALGAVLWAFSSYYFIIIAAGHIWKLLTLCFIPPTIAGMVLCYRGKYLAGTALTGLFTALQVLNNHVQMTYYFLFVMGFMALAYLIEAARAKAWAAWGKATACLVVGGLLGVSVNLSNLFHTWQYSKESMRGKTELQHTGQDAADQTSSGLERSYITAWSYGVGETWSLLVPNVKGGASVPLSANETAMKHARADLEGIYQAFTQYFGEQPGTSGPVYVGAFVCMLFVLGLFIVKGPMKWCLLAATLLSILLSWGRNFMGFTDFFLDYVPMYDKFRTVASILVIAEFTIPLLAMLALKKLVDEPEFLRSKEGLNSILYSFALTGGFCFLFWLLPDLFFGEYVSTNDQMAINQYTAAGYLTPDLGRTILDSIGEMRCAMFTADALRSLVVIVVGTLVLLVWRMEKIGTTSMVACLAILCLADMWAVNKRYLNDAMFQPQKSTQEMAPRTQADDFILQDTSLDYRVIDFSVSTFNDNTAAFYHKSIGGYHAAKLRRYQELIEAHIQHEMQALQNEVMTHGNLLQVNGDSLMPVLNMLNTKYALFPLQGGSKAPIQNPWALGNAWMVDRLTYVGSADDELASLGSINTRHEAVAREDMRPILGEVAPRQGSDTLTSTVTLTAYEPNRLTYHVEAQQDGVVVFSEIYYPGWTCTIDGEPVELGRVNYVLRAVRMTKGTHEVVLLFDPQTVHTTEAIAYASLAALALLLVACVAFEVRRRRKA